MNKSLKFAPPLVSLVLSGSKTSTWRLWDDKNLSVGDILDLINSKTKQKFATAKIIKTIEKPLGSLTEKDTLGHEKFSSDEEMYQAYKKYYSRDVTTETPVKIIWFTLL